MQDSAQESGRKISANPLKAIVGALLDMKQPRDATIPLLPDDFRIDGKTCLVTGANSGLGRAAAIDLARRGGRVILACRPGHIETRSEIMELSGSEHVEMMEVDLSDLESVHAFCDRLARRGARIDVALLNAGLATGRSRRSPQGYDLMFAVHFLANRVMIDRWLRDGVLGSAEAGGDIPRVVFVTSESHRSADAIDFDRFGAFSEYGLRGGLKHYGLSKLVQSTFATELSRRLNPPNSDGEVRVAVHAICPGGVATNITREAPRPLRPLVDALLRRTFQSPEAAARPVIWLCCADEPGASTGMYLHMAQRKSVSPAAADPVNGRKLWEASEALVAEQLPPTDATGVCVWFTGLSGSGKSTTAELLADLLIERGRRITLLDGDVVRTHLSRGLGFSREDRDANVRRIGFVAAEVVHHGGIAICAAISPFRDARDEVRRMVGPNRFVEVFVDTPLDVCEARDPKGLYARARRGELANFTGVSDPYEPPLQPEIALDTVRQSARRNTELILHYLFEERLVRVTHDQPADQ